MPILHCCIGPGPSYLPQRATKIERRQFSSIKAVRLLQSTGDRSRFISERVSGMCFGLASSDSRSPHDDDADRKGFLHGYVPFG